MQFVSPLVDISPKQHSRQTAAIPEMMPSESDDNVVDYGYGDAAPDADHSAYEDDRRDSHQQTTSSLGYEDSQPHPAAPDPFAREKHSDANDKYGYGDAYPDLGYGDARPDSSNDKRDRLGYGDGTPDLGYGEARPDSSNDKHDPYGYGDATPDLGYGDARPDSSNDKHDRYGYGNATPDLGSGDARRDSSNDKHDPYGYGDATPDLGYGDGSLDDRVNLGYGDATPDLGYGDAEPDSAKDPYGYGRANPDLGYGEATPDRPAALEYGDDATDDGEGPYQVGLNDDDVGTAGGGGGGRRRRVPPRTRSDETWMFTTAESNGESRSPRQRYRRRGSVTKYSIEEQNTVKQEYDEHANVIDQFRAAMNFRQEAGATHSTSHDHRTEEDKSQQQPQPENVQGGPYPEQPPLAVSAEDSFDEPTGLPSLSPRSDHGVENAGDSPRRFAEGDGKYGRKIGKGGKKLIQRLRRRFSMSS
jgi:hypothetical protein